MKAQARGFAPAKFGKVAVLMGGQSAEREVSLRSGAAVLAALQGRGVDAHGVDVRSAAVLDELRTQGYERAFIALHGRGGEDGVIQGALELLGIPYTGSGVTASALAMDKLKCKLLLQGAGLPTPAFMVLEQDTDFEYIAATLGLPLMVKPALEGSSIGMTRVEHAGQLPGAWRTAAECEGAVIAEQWVTGAEYTVAVLGDEALPAIRLETPHEFYDFSAKYEADTTRYHLPCGLPPEREAQLQRLSLAAFRATGAEGWGRVDLLTDADDKPWIIEINTVPGMTDHSLVPMAAEAAGIAFDELCWQILALTLQASGGEAGSTGNATRELGDGEPA